MDEIGNLPLFLDFPYSSISFPGFPDFADGWMDGWMDERYMLNVIISRALLGIGKWLFLV